MNVKSFYSSLWITRPERSFGSNQVVLGGMNITGIGNIHQLLHGDRIKRQRDLHLATVHTTLQFSQPTDTAYEIDAFIRTKIFYAQNLI